MHSSHGYPHNATRVVAIVGVMLPVLVACGGSPTKEPSAPQTVTPPVVESPPCEAKAPPAVITPLPDPEPVPRECPAVEPLAERYLPVIGEVEHALLDNGTLLQKARIDSGATTSSIGFADIENFERDGEKWVSFTIRDRVNGEMHAFKRRVERTAVIKQHGSDPVSRPVVKMEITIGDIERNVEVSLTNRDSFDFPVLIGRNFLNESALIDVSQRYIAAGIEAE